MRSATNIDIERDLSHVMFIATATWTQNPGPLPMHEVIPFDGYTIAKSRDRRGYLWPRQGERNASWP